MTNVYPQLKEFCKSEGYEFQVVDMRWGVRDESTADHMTTTLCMHEIKACQDLSTGPNFVVRTCQEIQEFLTVPIPMSFIPDECVQDRAEIKNSTICFFVYTTGTESDEFKIPFGTNSRLAIVSRLGIMFNATIVGYFT